MAQSFLEAFIVAFEVASLIHTRSLTCAFPLRDLSIFVQFNGSELEHSHCLCESASHQESRGGTF